MQQDRDNSNFVKRGPCSSCGSSDAVSVYDDGHGYCFNPKCGKYYKDYDGNGSNVISIKSKAPKKKKININNYNHIRGDKNEIPGSLIFTGPGGETRLRKKEKQLYDTHYIYTDKDGNTEFVIERKYEDETRQEKYFVPHSKWKNKIDSSTRWISKSMPQPRTIYNLPTLYNTKQTSVVVVEGEKAADAYKGLPVTTWSSGAKSVLNNDWTPLDDFNKIILFPDNDDEGRYAMHLLANHLIKDLEMPIEKIHYVLIPDEFPEKWDLADPIPENSNTDGHRLAFNALPYTEAAPDYKEIWEKMKQTKLDVDQKDKADRLLEVAADVFYIQELDEMLDLKQGVLLPIKSFNNNYSYLKVEKKLPATWLLEQEPEIFKRANSFEFNPKRPRGLNDVNGVPIVNRYKGPSIIGKDGDVKFWNQTMVDMFDDEKNADDAEQYFAWCFQNQGEKAMWAPLWISPNKGIGKNYITNLLGSCYGLQNFKPNLKYKHVTGRFNSWIIGTQFAVINEVFLSNNYSKKQELSEDLKDMITEPYIHIEEKFRRGFDYPNTCNFLLISNHEDCMNIADDERRYKVDKLNGKIKGRDYWGPRWDWAKGDGPRYLINHLKNLKIKDPELYTDRAPITDDMIELAKTSEHPIFKWLDEHREAETGPFKRKGSGEFRVFNYMVVATDLHRTCGAFKQEGSLDIVLNWCKKRSVSWDPTKEVKTKQITLKDGSRPRTYMLPPVEPTANEYWTNHLRAQTNTQLGEIYDDKGYGKNAKSNY